MSCAVISKQARLHSKCRLCWWHNAMPARFCSRHGQPILQRCECSIAKLDSRA